MTSFFKAMTALAPRPADEATMAHRSPLGKLPTITTQQAPKWQSIARQSGAVQSNVHRIQQTTATVLAAKQAQQANQKAQHPKLEELRNLALGESTNTASNVLGMF